MIATAGYAMCCVLVYHRASELVAITATLSTLVVVAESLLNTLRLTPVERIMVVLPTVLNVGLTWALACRAAQRADTFSKMQHLELC
jgi:hypothetical protein